jgi:hypothetical protein
MFCFFELFFGTITEQFALPEKDPLGFAATVFFSYSQG